MKPENKISAARKWIINGALTISLMALLPHIAKSTDVGDGMRIGSSATTNTLSSTSSVMIGAYNTGAAPYSLAVGSSNYLGSSSNGWGSIAVGSSNYLWGYYNFAFGGNNYVSGTHSMAVGQTNTSNAPYALTYGYNNQIPSTGTQALAGGSYNIAEGQNSVALGRYVTAKTYASMVIGQYNATGTAESDAAAKSSWRLTDPVFVIGNGTGPAVNQRTNALVVTKAGTATFTQPVILQGAAVAGDIPMYTGNN